MTRLVLFELSVTNLLLFEHQQKKLLVSWQFSWIYDVTKYGSGWWKDVVNLFLEFEFVAHSEHRFPAPSSWRKDVVKQCLAFEFVVKSRQLRSTASQPGYVTVMRERGNSHHHLAAAKTQFYIDHHVFHWARLIFIFIFTSEKMQSWFIKNIISC